ncbi:MAG: hypothetical protein AAB456_03420 [Patescibacteria group bacterium]
MGAPKGAKNALGNSGGKTLNDRKLAAEVRTLTLKKIKAILEMPEVKMKQDDYELYKAILVKLSGTVLPRLEEHTGEDGNPINANVVYLPVPVTSVDE